LRKVLSNCSGYQRSNLHLSANGVPTGFADVKFASFYEAKRAQAYLNGQLLNGTKIAATILQNPNVNASPARQNQFSPRNNSRNFTNQSPRQFGNSRPNNNQQSRPNRNNNFNNQNRRPSGPRRSMPSQDQLDLELEAYRNRK